MPDAIDSLILNGREERNLEYKQTMNWSNAATKAKLVKSCIAMANLRDGGTIVLGIERQPDDTYAPLGMEADDYESFNQDGVSTEVNNYADPFVELSVMRRELDGKRFVIIKLQEFQELPIVCKRDGEKLRAGAIYIRPRRKIETVEVPSQVDMRELLDLAIEKRVRILYGQIERMGAKLTFAKDPNSEAFDNQLGDL